MSNKELLSVIVPVYNKKTYIKTTIDAILNQTYHELEIILVDDGSTDGTGAICDEFADKDKRIKVIHTENGGVCAARNVGISHASGSWIGFCDADDIPDRDLYETLYKLALEHKADMSCIGARIRHKGGMIRDRHDGSLRIFSSPEEYFKAFFRSELFMSVYTKLLRADICKQLRFDPEHQINEDKFFCFEAGCICNKIVFLNVSKYTYIREGNSLSLQPHFEPKTFDMLYYAEKIEKCICAKYPSVIDNARAHTAATQLRLLKLMCLRNGVKQFPMEYKTLVKQLRDYSLAQSWKYLNKKNFIRMAVIHTNGYLFAFMTKYFDKY